MYKDLNFYENIIDEIDSVTADIAPDGLVVAMLEEPSQEELALEADYLETIRNKVKANDAFKDEDVIRYLQNLQYFYLLGIDA